SKRHNSLLGFVLCRVSRQGGHPVSAQRFPCRRAVNSGVLTCSGRRLPHYCDRRGMAIQVQQVLGEGAGDVVWLSNGSTQPMRQSDDQRAAELFDLGNYWLAVGARERGHQDDRAYLLPGFVEQRQE